MNLQLLLKSFQHKLTQRHQLNTTKYFSVLGLGKTTFHIILDYTFLSCRISWYLQITLFSVGYPGIYGLPCSLQDILVSIDYPVLCRICWYLQITLFSVGYPGIYRLPCSPGIYGLPCSLQDILVSMDYPVLCRISWYLWITLFSVGYPDIYGYFNYSNELSTRAMLI